MLLRWRVPEGHKERAGKEKWSLSAGQLHEGKKCQTLGNGRVRELETKYGHLFVVKEEAQRSERAEDVLSYLYVWVPTCLYCSTPVPFPSPKACVEFWSFLAQ
jgi:hypothetical protein